MFGNRLDVMMMIATFGIVTGRLKVLIVSPTTGACGARNRYGWGYRYKHRAGRAQSSSRVYPRVTAGFG